MMNERLGVIHFLFTYFGFLFTFFPMHIVGMLGMPRRVAVYDPAFTGHESADQLLGLRFGILHPSSSSTTSFTATSVVRSPAPIPGAP